MNTLNNHIIKVAINTNFNNKEPINGDKRYYSEGWINDDLTVEDFISCIKEGWAYTAQLSGNRSTKNYLCCNIASVDIDSGLTMDEALQKEFSKENLSIIYPTFNHTKEFPRFRLIFILPKIIETTQEQEIINRALGLIYKGDRAALDAARLFYGNTNCEPTSFDKSISHETYNKLLEMGVEIYSDKSNDYNPTSNQSKRKLPLDFNVNLNNNIYITAGSIKTKTQILCPFHHDTKSSAFIQTDQTGPLFLHCRVCKTTYWFKNYRSESIRNFPDFVETIKEFGSKSITSIHDFPVSFANSKISFLNNQHLEVDEIPDGITFIKSPKGTGKTTSLTNILEKLLRKKFLSILDFEEQSFTDPDISLNTQYRVLLIGHRVALIKDLCNRLGLNCYLDDNPSSSLSRKQKYGVCLDSLRNVQFHSYDMVIIDESEQVLSHFLADTLKDRETIFHLLDVIVFNTKKVVALDADIGWTSYLTLNWMKRDRGFHKSINFNNFIINEYIPPPQVIEIFESKIHLIADMFSSIMDGKRVFVSSNSKRLIDKINAFLKKPNFTHINVISITSENSTSNLVKDFIKNIKTESLKYDVILSSPTMGTGVDITFEDNQKLIDIVYGFFEPLVNTHLDIDQQISRVRQPGQIKVWLSHREFNFETDFDVVKADLIHNHFVQNSITGFDPLTHNEIFDENNPFLRLMSLIVSQQRFSKNKIKNNFVTYKTNTGWKCINVVKDDQVSKLGSQITKEGKILAADELYEFIFNSTPISQSDYEHLKELREGNQTLTSSELASFQRMSFELFYCSPFDRSLFDLDDNWRYRTSVVNFEKITNEELFNKFYGEIKSSKNNSNKLKILKDPLASVILLQNIFKTTPFYSNFKFDSSIEYTHSDLTKFASACTRFKDFIATQLGIPVRNDIASKSIQQLSEFLKLIGLEQKRTRTSTKDNVKTYFYKLCPSTLDNINEIVMSRSKYSDNRWVFINNLHGFVDVLSIESRVQNQDGLDESDQLFKSLLEDD